MKKITQVSKGFLALSLIMFSFSACEKDDDNNGNNNNGTFSAISTPYLVCASRNPGGVGFDFEYNGEEGGANNMDSLSVSDFEEDVLVKTIKGDNEGTAAAYNYIALFNDAQAVNYSSIDATCKGYTSFQALTYATASATELTFTSDNTYSFSGLTAGTSGSPLATEVNTQIAQMVIGDKWKASAKNAVADDELVWIIKTREGRWVKFIVTEFPATNAPTATGYINIEWDFLN